MKFKSEFAECKSENVCKLKKLIINALVDSLYIRGLGFNLNQRAIEKRRHK